MKSQRQSIMMELIATKAIETQEQLQRELAENGIITTQATISRDIRELHIVKETSSDGCCRYILPQQEDANTMARLNNILRECVIQVEYAQNIVVVKTLPGLASAACSAVDGMEFYGAVGSIAGDDTGMIVMRDSEQALAFCRELREIIGQSR